MHVYSMYATWGSSQPRIPFEDFKGRGWVGWGGGGGVG